MSGGKSGGTTIQTADLTPEQKAQIRAQTDFFTSTIAPAYQQAVGGAQDIYNLSSGGVTNAAQNQAAIGAQAQRALGETGESALRTGISGLENLFGRDYEAQQIQAALAPAQAQFGQNLAGLQAQFGGTGNLGSARQALAGQALAGQTQLQEQQAAAQVQQQLANQKLAAAQGLTGAGTSGAQLGLTGAQAGITAAQSPMAYLQQLASLYGGIGAMPQAQPQFGGTTGMTTSTGQQGASTTGGIQI